MKRVLPIAVLFLLSYCSDQRMDPLYDPIELSLRDINQLLENNLEVDKNILELEIYKIFDKHKLKIVTDERLLKVLINLRQGSFTNSSKSIAAKMAEPCTGEIQSYELVYVSHGERITVIHYKDGSTYHIWYDSNWNTLQKGCRPTSQQS